MSVHRPSSTVTPPYQMIIQLWFTYLSRLLLRVFIRWLPNYGSFILTIPFRDKGQKQLVITRTMSKDGESVSLRGLDHHNKLEKIEILSAASHIWNSRWCNGHLGCQALKVLRRVFGLSKILEVEKHDWIVEHSGGQRRVIELLSSQKGEKGARIASTLKAEKSA